MNETSCLFEVIHETIEQSGNHLRVKDLCRMAGVSRSGYYAWVQAAPVRAKQEQKDREDFELILWAYKKDNVSKGAKGIYMTLLHHEEKPILMNLKKIRRLMHKFRLVCTIRGRNPYRQLAKALQINAVADNILQREFESFGPRIVLLTDITYLPYHGAFAYLSTILDAFTKQILSYVVSDSLQVDFVLETVRQLLATHGASLNDETLVHSDQGCHYTSYSFRQILADNHLRQSMSRKGNCWDNAPQESFFGHMKDTINPKLAQCSTYEEVKDLIDWYMDYYNNRRYQWKLAKLSPNEYYQFVMTGRYPLDVENQPKAPSISKISSLVGK